MSKFLILILTISIISASSFDINKSIDSLKEAYPLLVSNIKLLISQNFPEFSNLYSLNSIPKNTPENFKCFLCKSIVNPIRESLLKNLDPDNIKKLAKLVCGVFLDYNSCGRLMDQFAEHFIFNIIRRVLNEKNFCYNLGFCLEGEDEEDAYDFANRVLKGKLNKKREGIKDYEHKVKMLHMTDIHIDKDYKENSTVFCDQDSCCHDPATPYARIKSGKYGAVAPKCDIPKITFDTFVEKIKEIKPDFIILTGDNSPHNYNLTQELNIGYASLVQESLDKAFEGGMQIYPTLGNHEKFPNDLYTLHEQDFLNNMAKIYKKYFGNDTEAFETFKKYGYYTLKHKDTKLRIVAMNCLLCSVRNAHLLGGNHEQAKEMFEWLYKVLLKAEKNNEYVYILDHFPINSDFTNNECALRMRAIIDRFEYIVRGYFSGHTHNDEIVRVGGYFEPRPLITINYVSPSLTTFDEINPSFRVYEVDTETYNLIDYHQWRFNMSESNKQDKPIWEMAYKATERFGVKDLTFMEEIVSVDVANSDYILNKYAHSNKGQRLMGDKNEILLNQCSIKYNTFSEVFECAYKNVFTPNFIYEILNIISGEWPKIPPE